MNDPSVPPIVPPAYQASVDVQSLSGSVAKSFTSKRFYDFAALKYARYDRQSDNGILTVSISDYNTHTVHTVTQTPLTNGSVSTQCASAPLSGSLFNATALDTLRPTGIQMLEGKATNTFTGTSDFEFTNTPATYHATRSMSRAGSYILRIAEHTRISDFFAFVSGPVSPEVFTDPLSYC